MPSLQEILDSAQKFQFEYVIILSDLSGEVKTAIGLNGFTKKINDTINSYLELLDRFGVKYTTTVYEVKTRKEISMLDIPMFFSIDENQNNLGIKPTGYM